MYIQLIRCTFYLIVQIAFSLRPGVRMSLQLRDKKAEICTFVLQLFYDFVGFLAVLKGHIQNISTK